MFQSRSTDKFEFTLEVILWVLLGVILIIPLLVIDKFYYPFIFTKALVFRVSVGLLFLVYLLLAVKSKKYRPKLNGLTIIFTLFLLSSFIPSVGVSVLTSLYALGQYFNLGFFVGQAGDRLAATLGNASYLAGYLIFNLLFAGYLWLWRRHNILAKFYYPLAIVLELFILLQTGTRGGFVALGVIIVSLLSFIVFKGLPQLKKISLAVLAVFIILVSLLFIFKDSPLVNKFSALQRLTSISLTDRTVVTRFMTWQAAWQGFLDRPVLGYGQENFNFVFNQNFNPAFYEDEGSSVWFDRAHNVFFDRLLAGGVIGLVLFLGFIFYPFYLWRRSLKKEKGSEAPADFYQSLSKLLLFLIIAAYFIQNLFVFDHLTTHISLLLSLSFLSFTFADRIYLERHLQPARNLVVLFLISASLLVPAFYYGSYKPALASRDVIKALIFEYADNADRAVNYYRQALSHGTYGNQEIRIMYATFFGNVLSATANAEFWQSAVQDVKQELTKQLQEQPDNVVNYLVAMRFNNAARVIDRSILSQNFDLFEKAKELSPARSHLYYEIGYTQLYLGADYKKEGNEVLAQGFFGDAINNFKRALDLAPKVIEANAAYAMALINVGQPDLALEHLQKMDQAGINYHRTDVLINMADSAIFFRSYELIKFIYIDLVKLEPSNLQYLMNLALAHAYLGKDDQAIALANQIKALSADNQASVDAFIQDVRNGEFSNSD